MAASVEVHKLRVRPPSDSALAPLAGVSLTVAPGETLSVVGNRRSGASTLARTLVASLPEGSVVTGRVRVDGANPLDPATPAARHAAYIGPQPFLHPKQALGRQLLTALREAGYDKRDAERRTGALLRAVGMGGSYGVAPHKLDVLDRHRATLALALSAGARVLVD